MSVALANASYTERAVMMAAKLTDEEYATDTPDGLCVNLHEAAHTTGDIRSQLQS